MSAEPSVPQGEARSGPLVRYEVRARVAPHRAQAYERYLREEHIPDLLRTGCFLEAEFCRVAGDAPDPGESVRFRSSYLAPDQEALDRYLSDHAPRLRAHALERIPDGLELERELWSVVERRLPGDGD